jgi:hypothetical protein
MRVPQGKATKGSQYWIQIAVNQRQDVIGGRISEKLSRVQGQDIVWKSPRASDQYAEYRDADFLKLLGLKDHVSSLKEFWARRGGPQWDALGITEQAQILLVEAKANISEMISECGAEDPKSVAMIEAGLREVKNHLKVPTECNWLQSFYQYGNRLAHLYFLRQKCGLDAYLIFVYFTGDFTLTPTSAPEWDGALALRNRVMKLNRRNRLSSYIADLYIDASELDGQVE